MEKCVAYSKFITAFSLCPVQCCPVQLHSVYLLQLLELSHVLLERRQLLLVGDSVLLEGRQGRLVLLLQLALLEHLNRRGSDQEVKVLKVWIRR